MFHHPPPLNLYSMSVLVRSISDEHIFLTCAESFYILTQVPMLLFFSAKSRLLGGYSAFGTGAGFNKAGKRYVLDMNSSSWCPWAGYFSHHIAETACHHFLVWPNRICLSQEHALFTDVCPQSQVPLGRVWLPWMNWPQGHPKETCLLPLLSLIASDPVFRRLAHLSRPTDWEELCFWRTINYTLALQSYRLGL